MSDYQNSDWIEWKGGECPLLHDTPVQVQFRDGMYSSLQPAMTAGYWHGNGSLETSCWQHNPENGGSDIIAYRIVGEAK